MQIQVDTREHKKEWERIERHFKSAGADYFRSKLKIFSQAEVSCINLDIEHIDEVLSAAQQSGTKVRKQKVA